MLNFFDNLKNRIQEAVKQDFAKIKKEVGQEKIYAIVLVTDSDCITLWLGVNTYEYLKKKDSEINSETEIKKMESYMSIDEIEEYKNGPPYTTKWFPDEWGYSDEKNSKLCEVSELLYKKQESLNSKEYSEYERLFFETLTSAFKELIRSGIFGDNEEITYFISMSDDDRAYEIETYSAKILNTEENYRKYMEWAESWDQ